MIADYPPEKGKVSYKWLEDLIQKDINPFHEDLLDGVFGEIFYHLRHLGLINLEKIHFDGEVEE